MLDDLLVLIDKSYLDIISSIIPLVSILFVILKIFFEIWNKSAFEKMITPKNIAIWENFLELTFTSFLLTIFGIFPLGYGIGLKIDYGKWGLLIILMFLIFVILFLFLWFITLIPKLISFIKRHNKFKIIIKCFLLLSSFGTLFIVLIIADFYWYLNDYDVLHMIFSGIIIFIFLTIFLYQIRSFKHKFDLNNNFVYKISKINTSYLKNLYFSYALKEDIHILRETKENNDDLSVVYVYYVKEDTIKI